MNNGLADYHIHTSLCNHAQGTMQAFVKSALKAGLAQMGFSDHNPMRSGSGGRFRMREKDFEIYFESIELLKRKFPEIDIKLGIELDFIEDEFDYLLEFVKKFDFDYIIGSVHYLRLNGNSDYKYLNEFTALPSSIKYQMYFEQIKNAAASGVFNIIGHFDLPKRFWGKLDNSEIEYAKDALETIKKHNLCIEVNTSGYRIPGLGEPFPDERLLVFVAELEVPVLLGSDSHHPAEIASYFGTAARLLKKIGITYLASFTKKEIHLNSISDL
ncbi:MAG TPA: histidinol-phosphatase HisJ family protein [bacterium]|nr:histidinol-phosphatase HisJ family protein [bacterium]